MLRTLTSLIILLAVSAGGATPPDVAGIGDSLMEGVCVAPQSFQSEFQWGAESGDTNMSPMHVLAGNVSGHSLLTTNIGHGSWTWIHMNAYSKAWIPAGSRYVVVHCGVNDVASGYDWNTAVTNLNAIKAYCDSLGAKFIVDDIFGDSALSDAMALTCRTWNTNYHIWCATNGAYAMTNHDYMGKIRGSTGEYDDIADAYVCGTGANVVHLNTNGVKAWVTNIWQTISRIESATNIFYVRPDGNDGNAGTQDSVAWAWRTIGKAAMTAGPGATVYVKAGTYNESVTNITSGVTFVGERGTGGDWLTIIDPSFPMTNWVLASEGSNGVYKTTGLSASIVEMTVGSERRRVPQIWTPDLVTNWIGSVFTNSGITTGIQLLSTPANIQLGQVRGMNTVWDVLGACFSSTGSVCYLRFKDGENPNTMDVRGAGNPINPTTSLEISNSVVEFGDGIYGTVWSNFWVRGAPGGFNFRFACHDNTIVSNKITGCFAKVQFLNDDLDPGDGPFRNSVLNNVLTGNRYATTVSGSWSTSYYTNSLIQTREMHYEWSKYMENQGGGFDIGVQLYNAGNSNVIGGNIITNTWANAIMIAGKRTNATQNTIIATNFMANHPSVGVVWQWSHIGTRICGNTFSDCNASLRSMGHSPTTLETNRLVYVYRNVSWLPDWGEHVFINFYPGDVNFRETVWMYNNSFSGGRAVFNTSSIATNNGFMPNWHIVNNICSGPWAWWVWEPGYNENPAYVGDFAYNLIQTNANVYDSGSIAWFGTNNIQRAVPQWDNNATPFSFALTNGSPAINAGLDVTVPFTLQGTNYGALPLTGTKSGSAWDMGAIEYLLPVAPSHIGSMRANKVIQR